MPAPETVQVDDATPVVQGPPKVISADNFASLGEKGPPKTVAVGGPPKVVPIDKKYNPWTDTKLMVKDPVNLVKDYPSEVGREKDAALSQINQGLQLMSKAEGPLAPVQAAGGLAQAALGTMQLIWSPASAAVTQFVSKPAEGALWAGTQALEKTGLVKRDISDMEDRPAVDFTLRHKDLQRTEEGVSEFLDFVAQNVAPVMVGGGSVETKAGAAEDARQAYLNLVKKNAEGAAKLADLWAETDPKLGEQLKAEATKGMSADAQRKLGEDIVGKDKPRVRIVGQTAEGKPKVRVVSPQEASAGLREGAAETHRSLAAEGEPWYYSQLERGLGESEVKSASPDSWKNITRKLQGVKAEEIDAVGLHDFLDSLKEQGMKTVPKDMIQSFIQENGVKVETKELGKETFPAAPSDEMHTAVFQDQQLIKHLREEGYFSADFNNRSYWSAVADHLDHRVNYLWQKIRDEIESKPAHKARLTLRNAVEQPEFKRLRGLLHEAEEMATVPDKDRPKWSSHRSIPDSTNYREILLKLPAMEGKYESPHWRGEGPVLSHIRMSDLSGMGGEKILGVHEIQSDWGQKGREIGFISKEKKLTPEEMFWAEGEYPPLGPFVTSTQGWLNLSLKRLMTYAVENGYDRIRFATGEQVQSAVGGDIKGQEKFYDEILPAAVKSLIKKFGGEIGEGFVVSITPLMRERLSQGVPLFQPFDLGKKFRDPVTQLWHDLYAKVSPALDRAISDAYREEMPLYTHDVLDMLVAGGGPLQDMLSHLRAHVDNVPIRMTNKAIRTSSKEVFKDAAGVYDSADHSIWLRTDAPGPVRYRTLVHEIIHAGTARFIRMNPTHPLTLELKATRLEALKRAQALIRDAKNHDVNMGHDTIEYTPSGVKGHGAFYGITDVLEFVAEAPTNPRFQKFLASSEKFASKWDKVKQLASKLGDTIAQILGVKQSDAKLLNAALSVTTRIIEKQAELGANIKATLDRRSLAAEGQAFKYSKLEKIPGFGVTMGKLAKYTEGAIRTFSPESLGPQAKEAASIIVKAIAEQMQKDSEFTTRSAVRRGFWQRNLDKATPFIDWLEKGARFKDPVFEEIRQYYKGWNERIAEQDKGSEFEYDEQDHYMAHIFEEGDKAINWLKQQAPKKWGDPGFIKDRTFDLYRQAREHGFTPKFTNPEDIMLARQHASDVAEMKVQTLRDMEAYGIATKMTKESHAAPNYPATQWRSPNGDWYWVHDNAYAVMHNAWNTKGLWELKGGAGDLFRGMMEVKNRIVPIRLMGSLFHPLHVTSIDNATSMMRASKELLSGKINPLEWGAKMAGGLFYKDLLGETLATANPLAHIEKFRGQQARGGNRLLQVWQGRIAAKDLTNADKQNLQYMFEGGLIPETAAQYRSHATQSLKDAIAARSPSTIWHAPWAAVESIQGLLFQHWIPSLKVASYLRDVQTALKTDPKLIDDPKARGLAFRKLAKSVDNRYGEMPYNTLFWNKLAKDAAVGSTLSLGWQLGFLREYGGGMLDIGQALREGGTLPQKAARGMLDRPLFVLFYSTQALAYGGLMTYALSGKPPSEPIDYFFPKTGDKDPNGKDARVGTMFYTKEFYSIYKHIQAQGVEKGLEDTIIAKGSGLVGLVKEVWTGQNAFNEDIRDSDGPLYKQLQETLLYVIGDIKPITAQAISRGTGTEKSRNLALGGFAPAPNYVTDTPTEGRVKAIFDKYYASKATPFDKAQFSAEAREAKQAYQKGDGAKAGELLDKLINKFDPEGRDPRLEARLVKSWESDETKELTPAIKMFTRMDAAEQKKLLNKMTPQERDEYLPHAKKILRYNYEAPQ